MTVKHPDLVDWRLRHGSLCQVCPLNGERKVGADGPPEAPHVTVLDMPSQDDAELGVAKGFKYGRAASSGAAYYWKLENLVVAGLAEIHRRAGRLWPGIELTKVQIVNVAMCHNPRDPRGKKPESKAARRCCANSLRAWLRRCRRVNKNISIHPCGTSPLQTLMRSKVAIDSYRGRFVGEIHGERLGPTEAEWDRYLADEPEDDIIRAVLRGKHPKEAWWPTFEVWLKGFIKFHKKTERASLRASKKAQESAFLCENPWLTAWNKLYIKQRTAVRAAAKREAP